MAVNKNNLPIEGSSPQCNPADHMFIHVETTPNVQLGSFGQISTQARSFVLYCSRCGEVREL